MTSWNTDLMQTVAWFESTLGQLLGEKIINERTPLPTIKPEEASSGTKKAPAVPARAFFVLVAGARFELATSGL